MIPPAKAKTKKQNNSNTAFARYSQQVANTVLRGIKMAEVPVVDQFISPLILVEVLKRAGPQSLVWKPETLCAYIDENYSGWTKEQVADALVSFHEAGVLTTSVPPLVRQKLYALRTIMTSDTAHVEWHIFEKVGCAFNNRLADFSTVEPMSFSECAVTIALMDIIRPDTLGHEVLAYVAAACHQAGLYTVAPSKYLKQADPLLRMMNQEETGRQTDDRIVSSIASKVAEIQKNPAGNSIEDDFVVVQAVRLFAADAAGDSAVG